MSEPLLAAHALSCVVGGQRLFSALDLAVREGDLVEIRGPNGSGKSTLLRCLAGLYFPQSGSVATSAPVAYLGHKTGLCADMSPLENLRWFAAVSNLRVGDVGLSGALDRVGLAGARHDRCGMLSAGQQRRAALARLVLGGAVVWLLDEPLTALDDAGTALARAFIDDHRAAGGATVCATHRSLALPPPTSPTRSSPAVRLPRTRVLALGG